MPALLPNQMNSRCGSPLLLPPLLPLLFVEAVAVADLLFLL
jgi:hypothetical protein